MQAGAVAALPPSLILPLPTNYPAPTLRPVVQGAPCCLPCAAPGGCPAGCRKIYNCSLYFWRPPYASLDLPLADFPAAAVGGERRRRDRAAHAAHRRRNRGPCRCPGCALRRTKRPRRDGGRTRHAAEQRPLGCRKQRGRPSRRGLPALERPQPLQRFKRTG